MNILLVCTGNTCRSPMAEAILKKLGEARGLSLSCTSAGVCAYPSSPMSPQAKSVLEEYYDVYGFDHKATPITRDALEKADLVIAMTEDHRQLLVQKFGFHEKVVVIPGGVSDPFGGDTLRYLQAAREIEAGLLTLLEKGQIHG
ncbi:MAG: low molecular weight protein arginine phosphatase [Clostridia bacterium]|nr:low molecular weight protein arginine phosphatase [Clostridia bacterium]